MSKYKRVGILGGMSPISTIKFYDLLIKKHFERNKNHAYPEIVIFSVNFDRIIKLQESNDVKAYVKELMVGIDSLQKAGADFVVIPSNTPHMVFDELQRKSNIPLLSIVKITANKAKNLGMKKLLLLGTKFTMQSNFYRDEFEKLRIEIVAPSLDEQSKINKIIYDELVNGIIKEESKKKILDTVKNYDVDGIILGCTELSLILSSRDIKIPLLDTLQILAEATLDYATKHEEGFDL